MPLRRSARIRRRRLREATIEDVLDWLRLPRNVRGVTEVRIRNVVQGSDIRGYGPGNSEQSITVRLPFDETEVQNYLLGADSSLDAQAYVARNPTSLGVFWGTERQRSARLSAVLDRIVSNSFLGQFTQRFMEEQMIVGGRVYISLQGASEGGEQAPMFISTRYFTDVEFNPQSIIAEIKNNLVQQYNDSVNYSDMNLELTGLEVELLRSAPSLQGAGHGVRSVQQASKVWVRFSPNSYSSCLWKALAIAKNWNRKNGAEILTNAAKQTQAGKNLKRAIVGGGEQSGEAYNEVDINDELLLKISDYLKQPIRIYNNVFQCICEVDPEEARKKVEPLELHLVNHHYAALIRRNALLDAGLNLNQIQTDLRGLQREDSWNMLAQMEVPKSVQALEAIDMVTGDDPTTMMSKEFDLEKLRKTLPTEQDHRMAVIDIETFVDERHHQIPYAIGCAWIDDQLREQYMAWFGLKCIESFFNWLMERSDLTNYTFYGHNAGRFDYPILFSQVLSKVADKKKVKIERMAELNGRLISLNLSLNNGKVKIQLLDSWCFMSQSLDSLTKEFRVANQKLTGTVDHAAINRDNFEEHFSVVAPYLENDCLGLLQCVGQFQNGIYQRYGCNLSEVCTAASLARLVYFRTFYETETPLHLLHPSIDAFCRQSYFGGRTEAFYIGEYTDRPTYYYDVTSLYPWVYTTFPLPYGEPIPCINTGECLATMGMDWLVGFYEVTVRSLENAWHRVPLHGIIKEQRLVFPHFKTWTRMVLYSEEIKEGMKQGLYEYRFHRGYAFKSAKFMSKFGETLFAEKASAKKAGNVALSKVQKILLNSLYGGFGLRTAARSRVECHPSHSNIWRKYLEEHRLQSVAFYPTFTLTRSYQDNAEASFVCVPVASAITALARRTLYRILNGIQRRGHQLMYCDTDSVISTMRLSPVAEEFCAEVGIPHDPKGNLLGSLKNEVNDAVPNAPEDAPIEHLCVIGPKFYAWKHGSYVSTKCKGYSQRDSRLEYDAYEMMCKSPNAFDIEQTQTQFRVPLSNWMNADKPFAVEVHRVPKKFGVRPYKKGRVEAADGHDEADRPLGPVYPLLLLDL